MVIDRSGHLSLHVEHQDKETKLTKTQTFIVSTKAMCLASPVFSRMFDPDRPWANASKSINKDDTLHGDDPAALEILLRIAHLQFLRLPLSLLSIDQFYNIAVLCDKYDMVELGMCLDSVHFCQLYTGGATLVPKDNYRLSACK